jgi:tryptophan 2,3-dioxygenase
MHKNYFHSKYKTSVFFALSKQSTMSNPGLYYADYLQLQKVLDAQQPVSFENGNTPAHDEMLFIIIHQAYELWFKQIQFEVDSAINIMLQPSINDNTPQLQTVVHRLNRVISILKVLVQQIDIMETMTPMDFLEFRNLLRPASGFQSWQFKTIEAKLGLQYEERYGQQYYISQLQQQHIDVIKNAEHNKSLLSLVNEWLERMPFFNESVSWEGFETKEPIAGIHPYWSTYRNVYKESLSGNESENLSVFDQLFINEEIAGRLSSKARRAALFIMLYRGYPILHLPFELLNTLLEIDEQLSTWRYRHMNMVHRTIGTRIGTGGSTGKDYLKAALDKHYIFKEIAQLTSFLVERSRLPQLPETVTNSMQFIFTH